MTERLTSQQIEEAVEETTIPLEEPAPGQTIALREPIVLPATLDADALSTFDLLQRRDKIEDVMRNVMVDGVHYGIPTNDQGKPVFQKPMLLKPGCEVLCTTFKLRPRYEELGSVHRDNIIAYRIRCVLVHWPDSNEISEGLGSCNSREKGVKATIARRRADVWEADNDILKKAALRALRTAILTGTAASDVFNTDQPEKTAADLHRILNGKAAGFDKDNPRPDGQSWIDWTRDVATSKWGVTSRSELDEEQLWELIRELDEQAIPFG